MPWTRVFLAPVTFLCLSLVPFCSVVRADDSTISLVTIGDSYLAGLGLKTEEKFAALIGRSLAESGVLATLVEGGYQATSASGLSWISTTNLGKAILAQPQHHAVILELGQNDCGFGIPLAKTEANLDGILSLLTQRGIPVLIVGTLAYDWCGADYATEFPKIFQRLASKYNQPLYPDFKDGIEGKTDLLRRDADHPNAAGEAIIVGRMLPALIDLLKRVSE